MVAAGSESVNLSRVPSRQTRAGDEPQVVVSFTNGFRSGSPGSRVESHRTDVPGGRHGERLLAAQRLTHKLEHEQIRSCGYDRAEPYPDPGKDAGGAISRSSVVDRRWQAFPQNSRLRNRVLMAAARDSDAIPLTLLSFHFELCPPWRLRRSPDEGFEQFSYYT